MVGFRVGGGVGHSRYPAGDSSLSVAQASWASWWGHPVGGLLPGATIHPPSDQASSTFLHPWARPRTQASESSSYARIPAGSGAVVSGQEGLVGALSPPPFTTLTDLA